MREGGFVQRERSSEHRLSVGERVCFGSPVQ
jgi:hypothetical protein